VVVFIAGCSGSRRKEIIGEYIDDSVNLFDAGAVILSDEGAKALSKESSALCGGSTGFFEKNNRLPVRFERRLYS